jgi:hypothetical protein
VVTLTLTTEQAALVAAACRNQRVGLVCGDAPLPSRVLLDEVIEQLTTEEA